MQRRVAVGPVVAAVVALVVFAVIVTVVITLAAASSPAEPSIPLAVDSPSTDPNDPSTAVPESTVIPPRSESTGTQCVDYTGEVDSLDIESARLVQNDRDEVAVEITLTEPLENAVAQLGVYAQRSDGDRAYQFVVELDDGEVDKVSAYELTRDDSDKLDSDDAEVDGSTVRFLVPRSLGKKLGDEWSWFAFSAANDSTIDACPGAPNAAEYLFVEH